MRQYVAAPGAIVFLDVSLAAHLFYKKKTTQSHERFNNERAVWENIFDVFRVKTLFCQGICDSKYIARPIRAYIAKQP